jgi:hypothetical protein
MADFTTAFIEGSRLMAKAETTTLGNPVSIGNPIGTVGEYDPKSSPVYETAFSADKIANVGLKPGQKRGHYGTTVFNPKRNDPEVEAVLGPDVYKQKISKNSPDAMRLEQLELKNLIAQQAAQIAMLTQIVSGGTQENTPITASEPIVTANSTPAISDYRAIAKEAGIKTFGRKKEEVVDELKDKGLM